MWRSSLQFSPQYSLSILAGIVLCSITLNSGCNSYSGKQNDHPNAAEDTGAAVQGTHDHPDTSKSTEAAVKKVVAILEKSLADLPPPSSAPAVCENEMTKLREVLKKAPGTADAASANSALLRCTAKATNETRCKGKPKPCGVVYYNSPINPPGPGQSGTEPSEAKAVDVSVADQIAAACREIAKAGDAALSASASAGAATGGSPILSSLVGNYSCGAWFKAAAGNDPTILIGLGFAPTIQLLRDLKTYASGVVDVTPEALLANSVQRVNHTLVIFPVKGAFIPVAVLPVVPVGGTPGPVLDGAHRIVQQRVNQLGKAVEDGCKEVGICH